MNKAEAAALLGVPEPEIADVFPHDEGEVVATTDGQSYIVVDGALMFLAAPHEKYGADFPVYSQPTEAPAPAEPVVEPEPEPVVEPAAPVVAPATKGRKS